MSTNSSLPYPIHAALAASPHQPDTIPVLSYQCACGNPVYFDSSLCLACGSALGFDPLADRILPAANSRLCSNGIRYNVCNWLIPPDSPDDLCLACRLNRTIPDLTRPGNLPLWSRIEAAKRRALRSLVNMGLPLRTLAEDPDAGLAFDIVSHIADPAISTGYLAGVITINLEEADDVHRRISQQQLGESSRTLLGHFHHECGHYVWELAFAPWPLDHPIRARYGPRSGRSRTSLNHRVHSGRFCSLLMRSIRSSMVASLPPFHCRTCSTTPEASRGRSTTSLRLLNSSRRGIL